MLKAIIIMAVSITHKVGIYNR